MRRILRMARLAVVMTIVFSMTVDTANACRLFQWIFAHHGSSCEVVQPCCPVPAPVVTSYRVVCEGTTAATPTYWGSVTDDQCREAPTEVMTPAAESDAPIVAVEESNDSEDPLPDEIMAEDSATPESTDEAAPVPETVETEEAPIANPLENPAEEPVESTTVGDSDLGNEPESGFDPVSADETAPAVDPVAADPDDDFGGFGAGGVGDEDGGIGGFGEPIEEAPIEETPIEQAPIEAAPIDSAPIEEVPVEEAPIETGPFDPGATEPDDTEDLFPSIDEPDDGDLFPTDEPQEDSDLFGGQGDVEDFDTAPEFEGDEDPIGDENPLEEAPTEEADDLEDLFGQNLRRKGMRVWTDNTGRYRTVGRLVVIAKTHVRLLKDNGRHTTVPLHRLSHQDLDYVMVVAKKLAGMQLIAAR